MQGAIIYISSNREKPEFENKIVEDMLEKKGNLPVYSVTQKPMVFGINKCVGNVGTSGFNICRQLQIVIGMVKEDYVISCEADCLYSPDYFRFIPPRLDAVYRNTNNYVIPYRQDYFYTKDSQLAFQVAGKDFLLKRLNYLLRGQPMWNTNMKNFPKEIRKPFLEEWETFKTRFGCFQFKTGDGLRKQTRHGKEAIPEIPYWGEAKKLREKYL